MNTKFFTSIVTIFSLAIELNENTKEDVYSNTEEMLKSIIDENKLDISQIISIVFTATRDIDSAYPAVVARKLGIVDASLMCVQEMYVENSLKMCIRAMVMVETDKKQNEMKNVYLNGATVLRPDLVNKR